MPLSEGIIKDKILSTCDSNQRDVAYKRSPCGLVRDD